MSTYLYIYENAERDAVYIGIGKSMRRVWEPHNADAEALLHAPGTKVLQTVHPFSTWQDARKAEAIAIHVAALAGKTVRHIDDMEDDEGVGEVTTEDSQLLVTNRAGTRSTTILVPAIYVRDGPDNIVLYEDLRSTAIVRILPDPIDYRPAPHGALTGASFAPRAEKWWGLESAHREQRPVRRLLAVLTGRPIVLGTWDLEAPYFAQDTGKWRFVLADPAADDVDGSKGCLLTFEDRYSFQNLGYSLDLRQQ
ncbi:hypothetical protein [Brachybacterium tyrofermentans]|uniref:hypothetical protein n=1 Tax=Brachybacterium tyrofermentans TaxID=47848 RepID=UPI003FD55284